MRNAQSYWREWCYLILTVIQILLHSGKILKESVMSLSDIKPALRKHLKAASLNQKPTH